MKFGLQNVKLLAKYYDQNICKKKCCNDAPYQIDHISINT